MSMVNPIQHLLGTTVPLRSTDQNTCLGSWRSASHLQHLSDCISMRAQMIRLAEQRIKEVTSYFGGF